MDSYESKELSTYKSQVIETDSSIHHASGENAPLLVDTDTATYLY